MLQRNLTTYSRIFIVLVGMMKVGYIQMMLFTYYFYIGSPYQDNYFKEIAAFAGGTIIPLFLWINISRYLMILMVEILFAVLMAVIPFTDPDVKIYGFLVGGGISILLFPIYAKEHFTQEYHLKLIICIWIAMGVGIVYYLILSSRQIPFLFNELYLTDDTTPYVFGCFSILNIILLSISKYKETPYYYSLNQVDNEYKLLYLVQDIYLPHLQDKILSGFNQAEQNLHTQPFIDSIRTISFVEISWKDNKKQLLILYSLAFFSGVSRVFQLITVSQYIYSQITNEIYYYFIYILMVVACVLGSVGLLNKKRKIITIFYYFVGLVTTIIEAIGEERKSISSFYNMAFLFSFIFLFSVVAPMVFILPFLYLKPHRIFIYFMMIWIGTVSNKIFINNAFTFDDFSNSENYNSLILTIIAQIFGIVSLYLLKNV